MSDVYVEPPDNTGSGNRIDHYGLTVNSLSVKRQRVIVKHDASTAHVVSAASNNATSLKATPGHVFDVRGFNVAAYPVYIKFYDTAGTPNPASSTVKCILGIQAGGQSSPAWPTGGIPFTTGIGYAIVKGIGDTDNTAVSAADAVVDIVYE